MAARFVLAILLFWPAIAAGQVKGRFYLQKENYAPGDPVFIYFEVTNSGTEPLEVLSALPYSFCSGYHLKVSTDTAPYSSCGPTGYGGSCASSGVTLAPGESRTERILLNFEHKIGADGNYEVDAVRELPYGPAGTLDFFKTPLTVRERLHFRVGDEVSPDTAAMQALVEQLRSSDPVARNEAARALASLAPPSLEGLLLTFADNPELRPWAPLAFHRLNTPRSLEGLAELLHKTEPGTNEHMQSAGFLAETGDPRWFPLLLEVAQENAKINNYVYAAAESGGDQMLPALLILLRSPDAELVRLNAISGFGYTGSRAAMPILLDLMRSPDAVTAGRANWGLQQLTHRSASGDAQAQYLQWMRWWSREGADAPIYKATAPCTEIRPLN